MKPWRRSPQRVKASNSRRNEVRQLGPGLMKLREKRREMGPKDDGEVGCRCLSRLMMRRGCRRRCRRPHDRALCPGQANVIFLWIRGLESTVGTTQVARVASLRAAMSRQQLAVAAPSSTMTRLESHEPHRGLVNGCSLQDDALGRSRNLSNPPLLACEVPTKPFEWSGRRKLGSQHD